MAWEVRIEFGIYTFFWSLVVIIVYINWTDLTLPTVSPTWITWPALKGLNIRINKPDAKLDKLFCKAKPIPKPKAPKAATKDVVGTPIWFKQINIRPTSNA